MNRRLSYIMLCSPILLYENVSLRSGIIAILNYIGVYLVRRKKQTVIKKVERKDFL